MKQPSHISLGMLGSSLLLSGCVSNSIAMGSASGASTVATRKAKKVPLKNAAPPMGTLSLVENQSAGWYTTITGQYHLPPTAKRLRLKVQQSNCFVVVERNRTGMAAMQRERDLMDFGGMGALFGASAGGSLGGYSNTPQGKVIAAAFMDAYNHTPQAVKGGLGKGGMLKVGNLFSYS